MGNIFARNKDDVPTAMKYYDKAVEANPEDNIAVNNIGANMLRQGKREEAKKYFNEALAINDKYPQLSYAGPNKFQDHLWICIYAPCRRGLGSIFICAASQRIKAKGAGTSQGEWLTGYDHK